ncbi:hypothetical protein ACTXGZ_12360 [Psychrobacter celer]|uniref:hypothetical protein n=1 Tax=Psychrobacter celer TaxID=306572 RepID=UPI003FD52901
MRNDESVHLKYMSAEDVNLVIKKMVPYDSPLAERVQPLVFDLISLSSKYLLDMQEFASSTDPILLSIDDCQAIIAMVKKNKKTETWAVSYMLAQFTTDHKDKLFTDACWQFMSKYLQIMLLIAQSDDNHYKKISKLGVRVRMALDTNSPQADILKKLITIHASSNNAYKNLSDIEAYEKSKYREEKDASAKTDNITKKIGEIRLAYEVAIKDKAFIERECRASSQESELKNVSDIRAARYTDEATRLIRIANQHYKNNVAKQENVADDDPPALLDNDYAPPRAAAKSSQLQQFQVKTNYLHSRRNQFLLPSNTRVLPILSYQHLFKKLWDIVIKGNLSERQVATVLLLSLLSGRQINAIILEISTNKSQRQFLVEEEDGETIIKNTINVTLNRRGKIKPHIKSDSNYFGLPLPPPVQAILQYKFEVKKDAIDALLKKLKSDLALPSFSSQHIESALTFIIKHEIKEPLHADMITGVEVEHSSPLYYTSVDVSSLLNTYQSALNILSDRCVKSLTDINFYKAKNTEVASKVFNSKSYHSWQGLKDPFFINMPIIASNTNKKYIGSEMALDDKACVKFFKILSDHVQDYNGRLIRDARNGTDTYIDQFNAYSLWLWHIIQIQTGIRPVNDAPGYLHQFNLMHDIYWVSDKAIRQGGEDNGRLIPISGFLKTALQNYLTYLNQFASLHNPIYPKHQLPIEDILQSKESLLQMFSYNPKKFRAASPGRIRGLLGGFLTHQDNWLRHQLRSMLTNKVDEVYICALFGHEHADQEMFHPMSSSSIVSYTSAMAAHLDEVAYRLQLTQVEVTLHG